MSKTLAIFGATGQQGSSVINFVLNDSELSQKYKIRAITRDVNSVKARDLKQRIEVVRGDALDRASLETALADVHVVFAMTAPSFEPDGLEIEYNAAKTIVDVAVERGVEYIIFSTLPGVAQISGGKYTKGTPFDAKAKAEQYIRSLPIKSAFYSPGSFMENYQAIPFLSPQLAGDGTWVLAHHISPKTRFPLIDATRDTGKFIGAILAEPDKYEGTTFHAAVALYSLEETAALMAKATGQIVVYKQISTEDARKSIPFGADSFIELYSFIEEFGGFGSPEPEKLVAWATENVRGKLTTFEEFLKANSFHLGG